MKKYTMLIIAGGLFLIVGIILSFNRKDNNTYYFEKGNLTQEEAQALILEKTRSIIAIYENPKDVFMLDKDYNDNGDYLMVLNYENIIYNMYTENGKEEIEKVKFDGKSFIKKEEDDFFVLKEISDNNKYSDCSISISDIVVNSNSVRAKVSFTKNEIDKNDTLTYYVYEKNIELIKNEEDKWLINTFIYSNV